MRHILLFLLILIAPHAVAAEESLITSEAASSEGSFRRPLVFRFGKHNESFKWESGHAPPTCIGMGQEASRECFLVREAAALADKEPLKVFRSPSGEIRRQFVLVVRDGDGWDRVALDMRVDVRRGSGVEVRTPGYRVEVVRGLTLNQLVFRVERDGKELPVYAAKHLSIPVGTSRSSLLSLKVDTEPVVYLATPDHLNLSEFEERGRAYALEHIREALETLHQLRVPSKAFPGKLVADVIGDRLLLTVVGIEQTDPWRMFGKSNERLLEGDSSEEVLRAVFARFVINGLRAYHYICSDKAACGAFQFTNSARFRTYDTVRKNYPGADIDPDFVRGSLSFVNGAKAAACLIDLELANRNLPDSVRKLFLEDQRFGGLFPIAAYNGGASQSIELAKLLAELQQKRGSPLSLDTIPWDYEPLVRSYNTGRPLKRETAVYLRKYQIVSRKLF